jgi:perosamine synthetase
LNTKRIFGNELKYVEEVLQSEFRSSSGSKFTTRFENAFAEKFGKKYGIAFTNGTATLHAALEAFGIGVGDEVIVPPLTMSATTFAVLQANATPVFADVDPETFQISAKSIEERITSKTKAIMTVALYGLGPDMAAIMTIARKHGLRVLEDNAECFLGAQDGKLIGTLGDAASYSFQSSKHLTSGEGGIIITDDLAVAESIRKVQSLGYAGVSATKGKISKQDIQDPDYSRHVSMGWNYRMPELCSAVALAQTENMEYLVSIRQSAAEILLTALEGYEKLLVAQKTPNGCTNSYWTLATKLNTDLVSWHDFRDSFIRNGGDGVYAAWKLTYLEPMFENMSLLGRERFISSENLMRYKPGLCPVAEEIQPRIIQFKTNYWNLDDAVEQAKVLKKTLDEWASKVA